MTDDDGVRHRLWAVAGGRRGRRPPDSPARLVAAASAGPVTIADGHHRYETALQYRDERRMTRSCEEDPAFDYLLTLFLEATGQPLTVLPTHRLVRGIGDDAAACLLERAAELFEVERVGSADDAGRALRGGGPGRGRRGQVRPVDPAGRRRPRRAPRGVRARPPAGGEAVRGLDVTLLGVALERLAGLDADAVKAGAIGYTKSAAEAVDAVRAGDGVDAAFLLEGTPGRRDLGRRQATAT